MFMKHPLPIPDDIHVKRPRALDELIDRLRRDYIVVLLGSSGSGKSKLIEKELIPKLAAGATKGRAGETWRIVSTTPSADPIGKLAAALAEPGALYPKETKPPNLKDSIKKQLLEEPDALRQIYSDAAEITPFNLLIVVDQLNHLSRFNTLLTTSAIGQDSIPDDVRYISLLLDVARSNIPVYLVLSCDNNYLEYFSRYLGLPEAMSTWRLTLPDISHTDIKKTFDPLLKDEAPGVRAFMEQQIDDNKQGDPHTILSQMLTAVRALIDKQIEDYKVLTEQGDPYAMLKFNLSQVLALEKWKADPKKDPPLKIYDDMGGMKGIVQYFAEKEVYETMKEPVAKTKSVGASAEQKRCAYIFKSMTGKSGNNQNVSYPTPVDKLISYCTHTVDYQKDKSISHAPAEPDIYDTLNRFKIKNENFIDWISSPQPIVDINSDVLLLNWERLRSWTDEETSHAQVYRGLVDKAFDYYKKYGDKVEIPDEALQQKGFWQWLKGGYKKMELELNRFRKQGDQIPEKIESGLYEGSELFSAMKWETDCQPTEQWAMRYPTKTPKLNEEETNNIRRAFPDEPIDQLSHFKVAQQFLEKSKQFRDAEMDAKQRQLETAVFRQRVAMVLSGIAIVVSVLALYFRHEAKEEKRNIEMIQFVRLLEENDILNLPRAIKSDTVLSLSKTIKSNARINSDAQVLDLLVERGVLKIDKENDTLKSIDFDALILLDNYIKIKDTLQPKNMGPMIEKLKALYHRHQHYVASPRNDNRFLQNPPLFNTMYAFIDAEQSMGIFKSAIDTLRQNTIINQNCVANVPMQANYYAFGDQFGRVWLQDIRDRAASRKDTLREAITCVSFSSNGNNLYIGTVSGKVYRYATNVFINTAQAAHELLFQSEFGPVYSIWERSPAEPLLVRSADKLFYMDYNGKGRSKVTNIPLPYVSSTKSDPGQNWLIATGYGKSILYQLDFKTKEVTQRAIFAHEYRTVLETACRADYTGKESFLWLAMGSIGGSVWAGKLYLSNLNGNNNQIINLDDLDDPSFKHTAWHREGPVSGLAFNPSFPQLACSSLEGAIELRNLDSREFLSALGANEPSLEIGENYQTLKSLDLDNDRILVDNRVQGISAITYLDANHLAIYQNSTSWVMKTNTDAVWKYLSCLFKDCK